MYRRSPDRPRQGRAPSPQNLTRQGPGRQNPGRQNPGRQNPGLRCLGRQCPIRQSLAYYQGGRSRQPAPARRQGPA